MEIHPNPESSTKQSYPYRLEGGLRLSNNYCSQNLSNQPLITIITVVFNGEKFIEDTIKNIVKINQIYKNVKYIVIDGGSNDGTVEIIRKYEADIEYWMSEPDNGIYDAMNKGWSLADHNSHILFLGAGDLILGLPTIDELHCNKAIFGKVSIGNNNFYDSIFSWKIKLGNTLHHQALLIHKSLCESPPFNTQYKVYGDYDLNARLFNEGVNFVFSESFSAYALPNGLTRKLYIQECLKVIEKNFGITWKALAMIYYLYQGFKYGFRRISIFS
jgi:glycosyltransferase involved in cell wall biosynthesis